MFDCALVVVVRCCLFVFVGVLFDICSLFVAC